VNHKAIMVGKIMAEGAVDTAEAVVAAAVDIVVAAIMAAAKKAGVEEEVAAAAAVGEAGREKTICLTIVASQFAMALSLPNES